MIAPKVWIAPWLIAAIGLTVATGCPNRRAKRTVTTGPVDTSRDRNLSTYDFSRELELVILENYLQLSVGNIEAYADSVAIDREVMLIGIGPDDTRMGPNPKLETLDRRPFRASDRCVEGPGGKKACLNVLSKRLDVHLYFDDSAGWLSDELSYRVPFGGRHATIPLRMTAVFIRDIDRWVLVMEHISYALTLDDILAQARSGRLPTPAPFKTRVSERGRARQMLRKTLDWLNANEMQRQTTENAMDRKHVQVRAMPPDQRREVVSDAWMSLRAPAPRAVAYGRQVYKQPSLAEQFREKTGGQVKVLVDNYRFDMTDNTSVAWLSANLTVEIREQPSSQPLRIKLRGTFLYGFDRLTGWSLVQSHISVPVTEPQLSNRVFGPANDAAKPQ